MIRGHDRFVSHFAEYRDCFVVIGGIAVHQILSSQALTARATRDFDLVLVMEVLKPAFFSAFWTFIREGAYRQREVVGRGQEFFRFLDPESEDFPCQIELFSRRPENLAIPAGVQLVRVPSGSEVASLSAILMDEDYYRLTMSHVMEMEGLPIAGQHALICLKARAFLDLRERRRAGLMADKRDINKHRSDVFRLIVTMQAGDPVEIPPSIQEDLRSFLTIMREENVDARQVLDSMGITISWPTEDLLQILEHSFIWKRDQ